MTHAGATAGHLTGPLVSPEKKLTSTRKQELEAIIKGEGLRPDPFNFGQFQKERLDEGDNGIRFLYPSWVFHQTITEKVLEGAYDAIMPYSAEFVPP